MGLASKLIPESVATSVPFRRLAFGAAYLALCNSAAHVIVALYFKQVPLEPLFLSNWFLMIFVGLAWMRIPPDRQGTDLALLRLSKVVILSFTICGFVALYLKPGL